MIVTFTILIKGTLIQSRKFYSILRFTWKQYPESFAFLILKILELLTLKVYIFRKKYATF